MNCIIIPYDSKNKAVLSQTARLLLAALDTLSQNLFGEKTAVLSYEKTKQTFHPLPLFKGRCAFPFVAAKALPDHFLLNHLTLLAAWKELNHSSNCINFYNPSFFLFDSYCNSEMVTAARRYGLALCADKSSGAVFGVSWNTCKGSRNWSRLHTALALLAEDLDDSGLSREILQEVFFVPPGLISAENSLALREISQRTVRKAPDVPVYLNTAFKEVLFPAGQAAVKEASPLTALIQHRNISRVPWIFNELANAMEYNLRIPVLESAPPEIHINSTGLCNLSCKFCSYTPTIGGKGDLTPEGLQNLAILKHVKTVRLSAGLESQL